MPIARHDPRFFDESDRSTKLLDSAEASVKLWTRGDAGRAQTGDAEAARASEVT
jgi:hypothetical protein